MRWFVLFLLVACAQVVEDKPEVVSTEQTVQERIVSQESAPDQSKVPQPAVQETVSDMSGESGLSGAVFIDSAFVHIRDLQSDSGPDLFVYLSKDETVGDAVNLGALKSTSGDQSYAIPEGVHVEEYSHVLIWCRAFGVLFGSAMLG